MKDKMYGRLDFSRIFFRIRLAREISFQRGRHELELRARLSTFRFHKFYFPDARK